MSSTEGKRKAHREPEPLNVGDGLRTKETPPRWAGLGLFRFLGEFCKDDERKHQHAKQCHEPHPLSSKA